MKKYLIGFIVGICLTVSSNVFAEQVKQFALTLAAYPIFVDGSKYTDTKFPILNYEGSTYVPLAKLGDLTGVNYTWNDSLHRVEIDTSTQISSSNVLPGAQKDGNVIVYTFDDDGNLRMAKGILAENESIRDFINGKEFKIVEEDIVGYNGIPDEEDPQLSIAKMKGEELPPKLSEGWVSESLVSKVFNLARVVGNANEYVYESFALSQEIMLRITFSEEWMKSEIGEETIDGIRIKKYKGINYFNIADFKSKLN